jgi:hypothetical protein
LHVPSVFDAEYPQQQGARHEAVKEKGQQAGRDADFGGGH